MKKTVTITFVATGRKAEITADIHKYLMARNVCHNAMNDTRFRQFNLVKICKGRVKR